MRTRVALVAARGPARRRRLRRRTADPCRAAPPGTPTPSAGAAAPAGAPRRTSPASRARACGPTGALPGARADAGRHATWRTIQKRGRLDPRHQPGHAAVQLAQPVHRQGRGLRRGHGPADRRRRSSAIPDKIQIKVIGYDDSACRVRRGRHGRHRRRHDDDQLRAVEGRQLLHRLLRRRAAGAGLHRLDRQGHRRPGRQEGLRGRRVDLAGQHRARRPPSRSRWARPAFADCLVAFQQNEVDAISTDDTILAGLAAQDPYAKVVGPRFTDEPYGMAMSPEHPEFTRFVNAVLAKNRANGTWTATYDKWLGDFGPAPAPPPAEYR